MHGHVGILAWPCIFYCVATRQLIRGHAKFVMSGGGEKPRFTYLLPKHSSIAFLMASPLRCLR